MSIASEISRLQTAKADLKTAIEGKGVTVPAATTLDGYADLVDEIEQGGGGGLVYEKDVNFIDYDGTLLYSYSFSEIALLETLPANPSHEGLVSQGWNMTLAEVKSYTPYYVGQLYTTLDGWCELEISLITELNFELKASGVTGKKVDWGDGSPVQTLSNNNPTHFYSSSGTYTIRLEGGLFSYASGSSPSKDSIIKVVTGSNDIFVGDAFRECRFLRNVICSSDVLIAARSFYQCNSLRCVVAYKLGGEYSDVFGRCWSLSKISLAPTNVSWVSSVGSTGCDVVDARLSMISYLDLNTDSQTPQTVVRKLFLNPSVNYTSVRCIQYYAAVFDEPNVSGFSRVNASKIVVRNASSVPERHYQNHSFLRWINIPSEVTTIGLYAFYNVASLRDVVFEGSLPPSMPNADTFSRNAADLRLRIPYASVDYLIATNYPSNINVYAGYGVFNNGESLPSVIGNYSLTWYASMEDQRNGTNPILNGNGSEVYCKYTMI